MSVWNALLIALCCRAAFKCANALRLLVSAGKANYDHKRSPQNSDSKLIAIVKVFREERTICDCVRYWTNALCTYPTLEFVIVGTERERSADQNPTLDAARLASNGNPRIRIIEAPAVVAQSAAGQLNYAISQIEGEPSSKWLLFSDIDTRYTTDGLEEITSLAQGDTRFLQQSGLFLSNFDQLSYLQKGHAWRQSRWTISHEVLRLWLYDVTGIVLAHVVGHGFCARLDAIREFGGFPDFGSAEDIELGFNLVCSGERIVLCKALDSSDNPLTLAEGISQEYAWSFGARDYPLYWTRMRRRKHERSAEKAARSLLMLSQGILLYCNWLFAAWIIAFAAISALHGSTSAIIFLGLYLSDFLICATLFARIGRVAFWKLALALPALIVAILRHSLPADLGLLKTLLGSNRAKYKTSHR